MGANWATNKERSAIVKQIRARDGALDCHWCGTPSRKSVDHVVSQSNGGPSELWNLVVSCVECNSSRGNRDDAGHCAFCASAHSRFLSGVDQ